MKNIILIGNGGHSKVIQSMINRTENYELKGILDQSIKSRYIDNHIFYDHTDNILEYKGQYQFVIAIGDNYTRERIVNSNYLDDSDFISIVDATAIVPENINIGVGTVVMPGTIINPGSSIGKHTILNTRSVVEHDNEIGDFVHISPNATLSGTVSIKNLVHVGSSATVIPNTTVYENTLIGAGSVVIDDIESDSVAVGVPAKVIKRRI